MSRTDTLACGVVSWSAALVLGLCGGCNAFDESLLARFAAGGSPGADAGAFDSGAGDSGQPNDAPDPGAAGASGDRDAAVPGDGGHPSDAAPPSQDAAPGEDEDGGELQPPACDALAASDYCSELPALPAPPVIDGELDCGPPLRTVAPVGWNGAGALPEDHAAAIAAAWRPDGLYFYAEVRGRAPSPHPSGQPIWCGDAVEIYVDADGVASANGRYDEPGSMQFIVAAPATPAAPPDAARFVQGSAQGAWSTPELAVVTLENGYAVEAFITAADMDLTSWSPQDRIGLDVAIGVAGASTDPNIRCGVLVGQYFLRVGSGSSCNGEPWCDTRAFCTPAL